MYCYNRTMQRSGTSSSFWFQRRTAAAPTFVKMRAKERANILYKELMAMKHGGCPRALPHIQYCKLAQDLGLSQEEAKTSLTALHNSGVVFRNGAFIYLHPQHIYDEMRVKACVPELDTEVIRLGEDDAAQLSSLRIEVAALDSRKTAIDLEIAKWRLAFWASFAALSAGQFFTMGYLTFVATEDGWDTMEPITYFISQAMITLWFFGFQRFQSDLSNDGYEEYIIPEVARAKYNLHGFDIDRWAALKRQIAELEAKL
eukprot:Sspe_Gene.19744::Locus_7203_Transcript_1_1_Confidence_1.000_Length_937::g.19744::m.19744/K20858/MCU; calcium uniporter protein, mitochondrial